MVIIRTPYCFSHLISLLKVILGGVNQISIFCDVLMRNQQKLFTAARFVTFAPLSREDKLLYGLQIDASPVVDVSNCRSEFINIPAMSDIIQQIYYRGSRVQLAIIRQIINNIYQLSRILANDTYMYSYNPTDTNSFGFYQIY